MFLSFSLFPLLLSPRCLISEVAWPIVMHHASHLTTCSTAAQIWPTNVPVRSEIWGSLPKKTFGGPHTSKFRRDFEQFRDVIANYLRIGTRCRQSENGVANHGQSRPTLCQNLLAKGPPNVSKIKPYPCRDRWGQDPL